MSASQRGDLPREMYIYDARGAYVVVVRQAEASKIGQYHAALKKWLHSPDDEPLRRFEQMVVVDENGVEHRFLTDPIALARLFQSREIRYESIYPHAT